jgi:two-component system sensor histidine kinase RegB
MGAPPESAASAVEDAAAVRLRWILRLRWAGLLSQVLVVLMSASLLTGASSALAVVIGGAVTNLLVQLLLVRGRLTPRQAERAVAGSIAVDVILLTLLLGLSGGPLNPFTFFYVVHVTTATVALSMAVAAGIGVLAALAYGVLFLPGVFDAETHMHLMHGPSFMLHVRGMWIAFAVTAAFIVVFVSNLRRTLALRDARLADIARLQERAQRLAGLATLAGGAAHELSTPLSTIALVADELEAALARPGGDDDIGDDVRLIQAEVRRCKEVLARLAADGGAPGGEQVVTVPLSAIVSDMVRGLERVRVETEVDITLGPGPGAQAVVVQPRALSSALRGLVKNALQAGPGEVVVAVDRHGDPASPRIRVVDRGAGIEPAVLARVGEPFFTTREPGEGMGLGVFLAATVVEQCGGRLQLDSRPGDGTTVTITLPTCTQGPT